MNILGIETSCDETGVAIYHSEQGLIAHSLHSQTLIHASYGGVMPEFASRDHTLKLVPLLDEALAQAKLALNQIDGIAYTKGPGLAGALMVGAMFARSLGFALNVPTIGIHHLEGHLLAAFLDHEQPQFPFLSLIVSGGHTELVHVLGHGKYKIIGDTLDDSAGEAFDKTAKLLGLGYPGGAALAQIADSVSSSPFKFPRPMVNRPGLDFSFSGLKTFVLNVVEAHRRNENLGENDIDAKTKAEIAYAFQQAVVDTLTIKCKRALQQTGVKSLVIAGGVSANLALRQSLFTLGEKLAIRIFFPRLEFCTDNGAMIAYAGFLRLQRGERDDLRVEVLPRWPL